MTAMSDKEFSHLVIIPPFKSAPHGVYQPGKICWRDTTGSIRTDRNYTNGHARKNG
jgi:hypothetical protein